MVGGSDRAQSVLDYSIGVSLFLLVVLGVLVFVPTAFSGLGGGSTGSSGDPLAAERGVTYLTQTAFTTGDTPSSLDIDCTLLFFTGTAGHPDVARSASDCGYEKGGPLAANLSLEPIHQINVTIERDTDGDGDREILCWHDADNTLQPVSACSGGNDVPLRVGANAVENGNFVVATRYSIFNGKGVYVTFRTW